MNKLKITTIIAIVATVLVSGQVALASVTTGNLSTGINAQVGVNVDGTVIAPPVANPPASAYTSTQNVTLSASGATSIHYTTDATIPSCTTGTVYSSPIVVSVSTAIQALSCYPGDKHSTVASYLYAINIPPSNTFTPPTGGGGGGGGGGGSIDTDADNDGDVDIQDFVLLMANWSSTSSNNPADFNDDGVVDIEDFVALMATWTL